MIATTAANDCLLGHWRGVCIYVWSAGRRMTLMRPMIGMLLLRQQTTSEMTMTESHLDACIQRACETPSEPEIEFIQRDGHIVGIKLRATRESLSNLGGNMIDFAYGHLDDEFHHFPEGKDGTVDVQWVISDD